MDDKVVLDRKSFEALAADSRVKILKSLKERRKTLSELSKELGMSVSGTKEHLQTLEDAELIVKMDDGHKWKYYELTRKGKDIVGPKEIKVWILLSISTMALIVSMFSLLSLGVAEVPQAMAAPMDDVAEEPTVTAESADAGMREAEVMYAVAPEEKNGQQEIQEAMPPMLETSAAAPQATAEFPTVPLLVALISAVAILGSVAILIRNRLS